MNPTIEFKTRDELADICNARGLTGIAVEVGVHVGCNALLFRSKWHGRLFIGVDPWQVYPGSDVDQATMDDYYRQAKLAMAGFGDMAKLERMTGLQWAAGVNDLDNIAPGGAPRQIDFCYLDADHSYESIKAELAAFWPLIKPGGILAGHDFLPDGWCVDNVPFKAYETREEALQHGAAAHEFGVQRAVKEFSTAIGVPFSVSDSAGAPDFWYPSWAMVKP